FSLIIIIFMFHFSYLSFFCLFFFFNDPSSTDIYTLSLHDALPIYTGIFLQKPFLRLSVNVSIRRIAQSTMSAHTSKPSPPSRKPDRKSTRLNSSHVKISYAVFCLKKKKKIK